MPLSPQALPPTSVASQQALFAVFARCLPWPVPALLVWGLAWATFVASAAVIDNTALRFCLACAIGVLCAAAATSRWRRAILGGGFPLSSLALGVGANVPAWAWLAALATLVALYPRHAWRDAPFFPTRKAALIGLDQHIQLPPGARIVDAGCGLGHGLQALRAVWPQAHLFGTEWSRGLAWLTRLRCPWATVQRGDMWAQSWHAFDLVYVFQRPESMQRALAKARSEMRPGTWLVSLEFAVPGEVAQVQRQAAGQRTVWAYRIAPMQDLEQKQRQKQKRKQDGFH